MLATVETPRYCAVIGNLIQTQRDIKLYWVFVNWRDILLIQRPVLAFLVDEGRYCAVAALAGTLCNEKVPLSA